MMSAREASDDNTIEYDNIHVPNFEDAAWDIQNQASHRVGKVTMQAPWPWWQSHCGRRRICWDHQTAERILWGGARW